jgi:hypothetical protein
MRAFEILNEEISISKYTPEVEETFYKAMSDTFRLIAKFEPTFDHYKTELDKNMSLSPIMGEIRDTFQKFYIDNIERLLTNLSRKITNEKVVVVVQDINDLGHANGVLIKLSKKTIEKLANQAVAAYQQYFYDVLEDQYNFFGEFFLHMRDKLEGAFERHVSSSDVEAVASTFIHELVHVMQHIPQFRKGRDETEYRSYLDHPKIKRKNRKAGIDGGEFSSAHTREFNQGEYSDRWWKLYKATPQEMAARSHQAAIDVLRAWNLFSKYVELDELPSDQDILSSVVEFASNVADKPTSPVEQKVYNRYIKLIYQEVDRYLAQLRAKLIKKKEDYEKSFEF